MPAIDRITGLTASVSFKAPCVVATTGPITLFGLQTIDAIAVAFPYRVLVKDQADSKQNGIYIASNHAWIRAQDFDDNRDAVTGTRVYVWGGATQSGEYTLTTIDDPVIFGTSLITFEASTLPSNQFSFQLADPNSLQRTLLSKVRENVSLLDYIPEAEYAAIWAGTSTYDCLPAMQAALAYKRPSSAYGAPYGASGYDIYCPPGTYNFSGRIEIKRQVRIFGAEAGAMANSSESTVFKFPANSDGIVVHAYNTIGDGVASPTTTQGSGSVIERLVLLGVRSGTFSPSDPTKPGKGVWMRAKTVIRDCRIQNFNHAGVYCWATAGAGDITEGNANNSKIENVRITGCFEGFHIQGADANIMTIMGCDASNNDTYGYFDNCFLGNAYIACHAATNGRQGKVSFGGNRYYTINAALAGTTTPGTGSNVWVLIQAGGVHPDYPLWVADNTYYLSYGYSGINANARNIFIGCYSEGDGVPGYVLTPSLVVGGLFGLTPHSTATAIATDGRTISQFKQSQLAGSTGAWSSRYAMDANNVLTLLATGDHPSGWAPWQWNAGDGTWQGIHANAANRVPYKITTLLSTGVLAGRSVALTGGNILFPTGIWVGGVTANSRLITTGTAAPTTGVFAKGDFVKNISLVLGGNTGWECVTTGAIATVAWAATTNYAVGTIVTNDSGKTYLCMTAGISAASGGPTGTGTGIVDGAAVWSFQPSFVFAPSGATVLEATAAYGGETISAGAVGAMSSGITVTGAALGDLINASLDKDLQGCILNAWVSAGNTVKYQLINPAGGAASVVLAAGTIKLRVRK